MTRPTWTEITHAVDAEPIARGLFHYTMSAEQNAAVTVGVDFEQCSYDSLGSLLADGLFAATDTDARAFFTALGVRY